MTHTKNYQNTYNFDQFSNENQHKELRRLEHQAKLVSSLEQHALQDIIHIQQGTLIDIGCGPGFVTGGIAEHHPTLDILGLDTSDELLNVATSVVKPCHSKLNFKNGDAYHTNLAEGTADIVYSRLLYQHLEHPKKAMLEAKRILKTGGKLCILDVDDQLQLFSPELPSFPKLQALAQSAQLANGGNRHIGRYLPQLMTDAGFSDVSCLIKGVTTLDIGFDAFYDIVVSFKAQIIGEQGHAILSQLTKEVASLPHKPFGMACVPVIIGIA